MLASFPPVFVTEYETENGRSLGKRLIMILAVCRMFGTGPTGISLHGKQAALVYSIDIAIHLPYKGMCKANTTHTCLRYMCCPPPIEIMCHIVWDPPSSVLFHARVLIIHTRENCHLHTSGYLTYLYQCTWLSTCMSIIVS